MKTHLLIASAFILLITSCKKSPESLSFSDFPMKQGDFWVYTRLGGSSIVFDTVTLSIASVYSSNDTTFYLWTQTNPHESDTLLSFYFNNTFVSIPGWNSAAFPLLDTIQFPIIDGWSDGSEQYLWYDHTMQVNNVNYNTCFRLIWYSGPYTTDTYIVKGVGIIKYNGFYNDEWDLLSYHLN